MGKRREWTAKEQAVAEVAAACGVSLEALGKCIGRPESVIRYRLLPAEAKKSKERYHANKGLQAEQRKTYGGRYREQNPERYAWHNMKIRCYNKNHISYPNYGGRGIEVCDKWLNSFEAFLADMGPKPSRSHQLDRIDNDGDYCPENCRWVTRKENQRNKTTNYKIKLNGKIVTLTEASEITGIPVWTLTHRLKRAGLPPEIATWEAYDKLPREVKQDITQLLKSLQLDK